MAELAYCGLHTNSVLLPVFASKDLLYIVMVIYVWMVSVVMRHL